MSIEQNKRNVGQDCLRVYALIAMVIVHFTGGDFSPPFARPIFFAMSAAPMFFFSFGMNMDRFLKRKDSLRQISQIIMFCLIAVLHNLYMMRWYPERNLCSWDFLFFLAICQVVLSVLDSNMKHSTWVLWAGVAVGAVALFCPRLEAGQFMTIYAPGIFTFFPWILVVILGLLHQRLSRLPRPRLASRVMCATCLALPFVETVIRPEGQEAYPYFAKGSLPYLFFFGGVSMFVIEAVNLVPGFFGGLLRVTRLDPIFSRHLLLGSILHYFVIYRANAVLHSRAVAPFLERHFRSTWLALGFAAVASLFLIMACAVWAWRMFRHSRVAMFLRRRLPLVALIGTLLALFGHGLISPAMAWRMPSLIAPIQSAILIFMAYLYLEIVEFKRTPSIAPGQQPAPVAPMLGQDAQHCAAQASMREEEGMAQ
jgi:hypothetical protein